MRIEQISKFSNNLMDRTEYIFEVFYDKATPTRNEIRQLIVEKTGVSPDLLVVQKISQHTGKKSAKVRAHVYSTKTQMEKIEPRYILKRNGLIKEEEKSENK